MKASESLFLSYQLTKLAATAPSSMPQTGGLGSSMPMASMMNQMNTSAQQNPLAAAQLNPAAAGGGMLARLSGAMKTSPSQILQSWKTMNMQNRGRALF